MRIYVDPVHGNDTNGSGTSGSPYKTVSHAIAALQSGDELIVNDSLSEYFIAEATTLVLNGLLNVTIRFLTIPGNAAANTRLKPATLGPSNASFLVKNCSNVHIEGINFVYCTDNQANHVHALRVEDSRDVTVSACHIVGTWSSSGTSEIELFSFKNSDATITNCSTNNLVNAFDRPMSFISVDGSGEYGIYTNSVQNVHQENAPFYAVHVKPETRKVEIDGLVVYNVQSHTMDMAHGILIESDASPVDFVVNGSKFSNIHTAILVKDIGIGISNKRIKHCTFYKCYRGIWASNSQLEIYSCSTHVPQYKMAHEYPPGHVLYYSTRGVEAVDESNVYVLNCLYTGLDYALYATNNSLIKAEHVIWNKCQKFIGYVTGGIVRATQFVRRVDPQYEGIDDSIYGDFTVSGVSPAVDTGKYYGEAFLGVAPDIGAIERSREMRVEDLPALAARTARFTDRIPLTNIDMIGMVSRGLETDNPSIQAAREGSAIKDISVKPLTTLMAPFTTELEYIRDQLSFANLTNLSEESADALAANVFVDRDFGGVASGVVRLYFNDPTSITLPAEMEFLDSGTQKYYSVQPIEMTAEEMALNFENGMYYMDTVIEAGGVGVSYNAVANSITRTSSPLASSVVAITNPYDLSGGRDKEDNYALKTKIDNAITVRDLVTKKGIRFVTLDTFQFVREVRPIGFRDPEMLRDVVYDRHIGGKVDIYVKTAMPVVESKIFSALEKVTPINLTTFGNVPVLRIVSIELLDPITLDTMDILMPENKYKLISNNPFTRFSVNEDLSLVIDDAYIGSAAKINYQWVPEIKVLQSWVEDSDQRVVCADLLVKHFQPAFVDFSISYYAPEEIQAMDAVFAYDVNNLASEQPLQSSDITDQAYNLGVTKVFEPFTMHIELHDVYGNVSVVDSEDEVLMDRITRFIARNITVEYLGPDPTAPLIS